MPKRQIQYVEFKLARPRWDALRAATRKLRRVLGEEAPTVEQLIAYQFSRRDARLVANEYRGDQPRALASSCGQRPVT